MQEHVNPLIDHIHLHCRDYDKSCHFYLAIFEALGRGDEMQAGRDWLRLAEFYLDGCDAVSPPSRLHLCFKAKDRAAVDRFHAEGLTAGGRDNGSPGLRDYHPGYYAAYLLDPDGNNIEAKFMDRDV